tara:strand:+ start:1191 stop:2426 length:1236 start_codon:yes stop_codon:yes gene_type:complete
MKYGQDSPELDRLRQNYSKSEIIDQWDLFWNEETESWFHSYYDRNGRRDAYDTRVGDKSDPHRAAAQVDIDGISDEADFLRASGQVGAMLENRRVTQSEQRWRYFKAYMLSDILVEEYAVANVKKLILESVEEVPPEAADITVGEMLEKIEELEKLQLERGPVLKVISFLDSKVADWLSLVQKDVKNIRDGEDDQEARGLAELEVELIDLQQSVGNMKTNLMDKDHGFIDLTKDAWEIFRTWTGLIKMGKTLATDLDIGSWDNIFAASENMFDQLGEIPLLATMSGMGKDMAKLLDWAKTGIQFIGQKTGILKQDPDKAISNMASMVSQEPDTKFRSAPFLELMNIDDEYIAMLDEDLQVKFISWYKEFLEQQGLEIKIKDLDIDKALEDWIPRQSEYEGHGIKSETSDEI